jgi:hypothetical protein
LALIGHGANLTWTFEENRSGARRKRAMSRFLILLLALAALLTACAPDSARNADCAREAQGNTRWGYYPGYGCGPVPPALTKYP